MKRIIFFTLLTLSFIQNSISQCNSGIGGPPLPCCEVTEIPKDLTLDCQYFHSFRKGATNQGIPNYVQNVYAGSTTGLVLEDPFSTVVKTACIEFYVANLRPEWSVYDQNDPCGCFTALVTFDLCNEISVAGFGWKCQDRDIIFTDIVCFLDSEPAPPGDCCL